MRKCEIIYASHSDHSFVAMELQRNIQYPRGPGFWKFNSALLEDKDYTEDLTVKIPQFIEKYNYVEDKGYASYTIEFTKRKARRCKDLEMVLTEEVGRLQKVVDTHPTCKSRQELTAVKNKLDAISLERAHGACVRSKARWYEIGERGSKYFLNLEEKIMKINVLKA